MNTTDLKTKQTINQLNHAAGVEIRISAPVLERVCKQMIEIILYALPLATQGTIYKVGPIPNLRVVRIASGHRDIETDEVFWDGSTQSDYDYPGKVWEDYCDRPEGTLEAMAWCVETQKSWTADDPEHNGRSGRKRLEGRAWEDYHHMEPVLIQKTDLWDSLPPPNAYPKNEQGNPIWQDSPYATVAVIKIHFLPRAIKRGSKSTRVIKDLSHSLGTQMLSLHAKEVALEKQKSLAEERQETCDILAHEFRNLVPKVGYAYRVINNEIAYLRESWETLLHQYFPEQPNKREILQKLEDILESVRKERTLVEPSKEGPAYKGGISTGQAGREDTFDEISKLLKYQKQMMESSLLPWQNEIWLRQKIRPLWLSILSKIKLASAEQSRVDKLLEELRTSFHVGLDKGLKDKIEVLPEKIKTKWVDLAYREVNGTTNGMMEQYIELLDNIHLDLPRKRHSLRNFIYLKALVELIPEIEKKLNHRLELMKNSGHPPSPRLRDITEDGLQMTDDRKIITKK